jgi:hypothetical protein
MEEVNANFKNFVSIYQVHFVHSGIACPPFDTGFEYTPPYLGPHYPG